MELSRLLWQSSLHSSDVMLERLWRIEDVGVSTVYMCVSHNHTESNILIDKEYKNENAGLLSGMHCGNHQSAIPVHSVQYHLEEPTDAARHKRTAKHKERNEETASPKHSC